MKNIYNNKSLKGANLVNQLDPSQRLASVRVTTPATNEKELFIHGRTLVKNLENNFLKLYGICVQVCYNRDGNRYYTSGSSDDISLTQLNAKLEKEGAEKKPK